MMRKLVASFAECFYPSVVARGIDRIVKWLMKRTYLRRVRFAMYLRMFCYQNAILQYYTISNMCIIKNK